MSEPLQGRLAEEHHRSLQLDAGRRAYYKKTRKHLKENVLQADNEVVSMPEDPELQGAPSDRRRPPAMLCFINLVIRGYGWCQSSRERYDVICVIMSREKTFFVLFGTELPDSSLIEHAATRMQYERTEAELHNELVSLVDMTRLAGIATSM